MDAPRTSDAIDELAGIRWRQGVQSRTPRLWLDQPRAGGLSVLATPDELVPPRARVLATAVAAAMAGLTARRAVLAPYGQPFQLGAGAAELLPSGAVAGGALLRMHTRTQSVLAVRTAALTPEPLAQALDVRDADVLLVDAGLAAMTTWTHAAVVEQLQAALALGRPAVWLVAEPTVALSLAVGAGAPVRVSPSLARLWARAAHAGVPVPFADKPGRAAEGVLLWPLQQVGTLPLAWRDVPHTAVVPPDAAKVPTAIRTLPYTRRLTLPTLDALAEAVPWRQILAYGEGAATWTAAWVARGVDARVLRVPQQLPLLTPHT